MDERRIYSARPKGEAKRSFEWVALPEGDICMWSLTMAEACNISEQARRPSFGDQPARVDGTMSGALEVLICARSDEPGKPGAHQIFSDIQQVYDLPYAEFMELVKAGMRANGKDEASLETLEDFTEARQATKSAS